ncbi:MAG: cytidine deaminase [Clostridiales bacterium]|nr:cytidine deaminase [Clostridiales bacterium]
MQKLIEAALNAREKSYSPYSNFKVGAALLTKDGEIYGGANIENAAYGPSNCAERTAFFSAVFDGHRDFKAIAVCGGADEVTDYCYPCGVCRQVMREFCNPETFKIYIVKSKDNYREYLLKDLLPLSFGPEDLV